MLTTQMTVADNPVGVVLPPGYDLTLELSDWTCDADTCGITETCGACQRRERVARLLAQRDLERRPCQLDCTTARPCDRCAEIDAYLRWLYVERNNLALFLRLFRRMARVYPAELRELLVGPVIDIMAVSKEAQP
jgi:hypothetical protein